ncbi:class IV adenylate cyclase [Candidatus Micrarchaeota archaeon]|nr:class IV adenylate cyclase [Candidatus Micrarchaeota archaeon]
MTVFLKNPKEVQKKLNEIASFIKEKNQKDKYFVPKNRDFFQEKPTKEYLRIRHQEGHSKLAYHFCHFQNNGDLLKSDEYETEIKDPKTMTEILEKLGFIKKVTVTKHRKYYEYKNFEVLIDYIKELVIF